MHFGRYKQEEIRDFGRPFLGSLVRSKNTHGAASSMPGVLWRLFEREYVENENEVRGGRNKRGGEKKERDGEKR